MIDRPFYYNIPLDLELKGLNKAQVLTLYENQGHQRMGLFMAISAVAFLAISALAYAAVAYFSQDTAKAVVIAVTGFVLGGGSAGFFYNYFFKLDVVRNEVMAKYNTEGEIALSDIGKILSVATPETQKQLIKLMSFEQAVIARKFVDPEKFKKWVKGADWSSVFNYKAENADEYRAIIEKNQWVLRAIEHNLDEKQKLDFARRNLVGDKSELIGILRLFKKLNEKAEKPDEEVLQLPEIVDKLISGEVVELNKDNLVSLIKAADYLQSGELARFVDEYIYSHIDIFNQNDLIELVYDNQDLIKVRSYLARQILSRKLNEKNVMELWILAEKVAKSELRAHFLNSRLITEHSILKEMMTMQQYKVWISCQNVNFVSNLFIEEFKSPTHYFDIYYNFLIKYYTPEGFLAAFSSLKVDKNNCIYLLKYKEFKQEAEKFILDNWKELFVEKTFTFFTLMETFPNIQKELLQFIKDNHKSLINNKVITEKAWKDYKFIYFS